MDYVKLEETQFLSFRYYSPSEATKLILCRCVCMYVCMCVRMKNIEERLRARMIRKETIMPPTNYKGRQGDWSKIQEEYLKFGLRKFGIVQSHYYSKRFHRHPINVSAGNNIGLPKANSSRKIKGNQEHCF